jgi:hypothetical protein
MASGDASWPENDSTSAVRQLNVGLLRVLLRFPVLGSPLYLEEEGRLIQSLLAVLRDLIVHRPWLRKRYDADTLATGVCYDLLLAWRSGAPLWFTPGYLWNLVRRHLEKDGRSPGGASRLDELADGKPNAAELAEEVERALRLADEFRAGLAAEERRLFEAWVKRTGRPGWKKAYAVATRRSPTWVSNHLDHLREGLRVRHHIADPDDFVDALQFYTPREKDEVPEGDEPLKPPPAKGSEARPPRVDLAEVFQGQPELLELMRVCGDRQALGDEQVRQALFGQGCGNLDALLGRAVDRFLDWAREVGRPRVTAWKFYRRIASGRINVEAILARDAAAWTDEERRQAKCLVECARSGHQPAVPFEDLPAHLGLGRRAVDQLLLKLQTAVSGRDQRDRRGPSRPLSGG